MDYEGTNMKYLKIGGLLCLLLTVLTIFTSKDQHAQHYDDFLRVSFKTQKAFDVIKSKKDELDISYEHESGMIGQDYSLITTTLGSKESKTTSTNPEFAAVIYKYVLRLGLKKGDRVAVNLSGSFPSLNIATIIVLEDMGLVPVIQSSIGASTYGANDPEMTNMDMEYYLREAGLIDSKSIIFTNGGHNDTGSDMDNVTLDIIVDRLEGYGYNHYYNEHLDENISYRLSLFRDTKALINVGGNMVSQTQGDLGFFSDYGYISHRKLNYNKNGLIGEFLSSDRDVIQLLDIKAIAVDEGLCLDTLISQIGVGDIFYEKEKSVVLVCSTLMISIATCIGVFYDRRQKEKDAVERHVSAQFVD